MIIKVLFTVNSPNINGDISESMNDCGVASMVLKIEETSKMLLDRIDF